MFLEDVNTSFLFNWKCLLTVFRITQPNINKITEFSRKIITILKTILNVKADKIVKYSKHTRTFRMQRKFLRDFYG